MRKIGILVLALALIAALYGAAEAGVAGSKHDMYVRGKGTDKNVCSYCHMPHKAAGEMIWSTWGNEAQLTNGPSSRIGNMCYTCHDGTATSDGQYTVFNTARQQHKVSAGMDCDMCHTVHDDTNNYFLGIYKTSTADTQYPTYCEYCHDDTMYPGAEPLGNHLAGSEHPYYKAGTVLGKSCNTCHVIHGAKKYSAGKITHPILRQDNTDAAYCAFCHSDYVEDKTGGKKHPANLASAGKWGKINCNKCHDIHQPKNNGRRPLLDSYNYDSKYCTKCHQANDKSKGPSIGKHTHPTGGAFTTIGLTPSAKDIDDNNDTAPDYPRNTEVLACESCHSAHSKGVEANMLRITKDRGAICINCHNDK